MYGDDFDINQINEWFAGEQGGYANLGAKNWVDYSYGYHRLNYQHGYKYIVNKSFNNTLGFGNAYGDELKQIVNNITGNITILDPSDVFSDVKEIYGAPCNYIKSNPNGNMSFKNDEFDLVTCLGVLHHIPNVSHVIKEAYRCLSPGGYMLLREPIVSMGDWRQPRKGLTKRERGVSVNIMDEIIKNSGFKVRNRSFCIFQLIPKLANKLGVSSYNNLH